ncbi:beta-ketoacyl synthase N-terminal-like domain-containing protein [Plantactinospora sp. B24E8]|uniref:beta-ketoacyl-[acyl-carrier-protein] synthase family protein n=1 Tax=Plantactinospora sp. B24E8 TaxID=3153567 RepID=UPI00325D282E
MTDVLVTGIGAVSCHGRGAAALWRAMRDARVRLPDRPADPLAHMALPLIYLVPEDHVPAEHPGRAAQFAVTAAAEALRDAGLTGRERTRFGVVVGSCMGEAGLREADRYPESRTAGRRPAFQLATHLGAWLGGIGANSSIANACSAGLFALCTAVDMLRCGEVDVVLAGGADAYSRVALGCFNRLGAVDPVRCRPYDRHRAGTVFGEGAGMLVLESREHARARGVGTGYARVTGTGWSCDAHHPTAPEPAGDQITRAMREALAEAGDDGVGCVLPHGTGTQLNDVTESGALHRALGPAAGSVPLYSLKALIGHTGGAAAGLAACAAALILRHRVVPPNVPLDEPDPACPVRLPVGAGTALDVDRVLVNAYGFGGTNASVVLAADGGGVR